MVRLPRVVLQGIPHHITQRGNRRERTFFEDGDYALYLDLLADAAERAGVEIRSYCLMPNHVHIIAAPSDADGLRRTFRFVHRHYTGYINARLRTTGHLWQGRFSSVAMDEPHFVTALRYVALNPVRARLVVRAEDWPWSSTRALMAGEDDHVVKVGPALERVGDFAAFLGEPFNEALSYAALRKAESVGRPIGSPEWLADMEAKTGLTLAPQRRGPKPRVISPKPTISPASMAWPGTGDGPDGRGGEGGRGLRGNDQGHGSFS
jgi:putative transposase